LDLVQKVGKTLNFIDKDRSDLLFRDFLFRFPAEKLGRTRIPKKEIAFQEIDAPRCSAKKGAGESALAGLARAEEEERTGLREVDNPVYHPARV